MKTKITKQVIKLFLALFCICFIISFIMESSSSNKFFTQFFLVFMTLFYFFIKIPIIICIRKRGVQIDKSELYEPSIGVLFILSGNHLELLQYPIYYIFKSIFGLLAIFSLFKPKPFDV